MLSHRRLPILGAWLDMKKALEWYAESARKVTREGDEARDDLDVDGGKRARRALEKVRITE